MGEVPVMRVPSAEAFDALAERVDRLEAAANRPPLTVTVTTEGGNLVSVGATGVQAKARRVEVKSRHVVSGRGTIWVVGADPTLVPGILVTDGEAVAKVTGIETQGAARDMGLVVRIGGKPEAAKAEEAKLVDDAVSPITFAWRDGKLRVIRDGKEIDTIEDVEGKPPTLSADANNRLTLGSDGGLYLGGIAISGKVTLASLDGTSVCEAAMAPPNGEGFPDPAAARKGRGRYQGLIDVPLNGRGGIDWHAVEALVKLKILEARIGR